MQSLHTKGILATILAALIWSTGGVFIKILPQDAFTILMFRSLYAAFLFAFVFGKKIWQINRYSVGASLSYVIVLFGFVQATKLTTAANAIFLQYTAPVFVLLLEPFLLKTKLTRVNSITVLICFLGLSLFFIGDFRTPDNWLGISLALCSGLGLTAVLLFQRKNDPDMQPASIFYGNILVALLVAPFVSGISEISISAHGILLFLGLGQIGFGWMLFTYGQRYLSAVESSLIAMLEPVLNPVWVLIWYGEAPGFWAGVGGMLIIGALILRLVALEWKRRKRLKVPGSL